MVQYAAAESRPDYSSPQAGSRYRDAAAVLLLAALAVWLFRGHFFGDSLWIGNPDRLNGDLKYLRHYLSGLGSGALSAWNEHEMMGYDSLAMAGTSTNPLVYLAAIFGEANLYVSMGYFAIGLLFASGVAAYAFLRALVPPGAAALVGAICYEFSALSILKDSQNSMTFAVFVLIPLFMLALHHVRRETAAWCFAALAVLLGAMLNYMFLQKAAYALMLVGSYALWLSWTQRSWRPALVFSLAFLIGLGFALPRILAVGLALGEFKRAIAGIDLKDFDVLYAFQNIYPYEILRWFDYPIFGHSPSDSIAIRNNINLTEGLLLATSSVVPFLLLVGLVRSRYAWLNPLRASEREEGFFFWTLILCISVIVVKPAAHLMFLLFLKLDFTHARIQISALLPLAMMVAVALEVMAPPREEAAKAMRHGLQGLSIGLLVAIVIDAIARQYPQTRSFAGLFPSIVLQASFVRIESLVRVLLSVVAFLALLRLVLNGSEQWRQRAYAALCALIATQCLLSANSQVNGPHTLEFSRPFYRGDSYQARREEFAVPDKAQLSALHQRIEPGKYRVALICDSRIADGFCAGHVPEFWQLRAIDGYYGPGVPRRLRALPWPSSVSLRTISFTKVESVPWDLIGLLNVRWVLVAGDGVFRNIATDGDRITGRPDPAKFEIVPSPARVTPRAFFAAAARPVATPEEAAAQLFRPDGIVDPVETSYVEGLNGARTFPRGGPVAVDGTNDLLTLRFEPSPSERFLVLNELYYPGWKADANGRELPVLAANAVMRGVVVPAGAASVRFHYSSFLDSATAWAFRLVALAALVALFLAFRRSGRR